MVIQKSHRTELFLIDYKGGKAVKKIFKENIKGIQKEVKACELYKDYDWCPKIYEWGEDYIIYEYYNEKIWKQLYKNREKLTDEQKKKILNKVVVIAYEIYKSGYEHKDLHTMNFLYNDNLDVILLDYEHFDKRNKKIDFIKSRDINGSGWAFMMLDNRYSVKNVLDATIEKIKKIISDYTMGKFLTKEKFFKLKEQYKNDIHWKSNVERWEYHEKVVNLLKDIDFKTVLEAGTVGVKIYEDSDTIDLDKPHSSWKQYIEPTYKQNLKNIPWCVDNNKYDVFIALRVFQYLTDKPKEYIDEMFRVSKHVILALPKHSVNFFKNIKKPDLEMTCDTSDTVILYYKK